MQKGKMEPTKLSEGELIDKIISDLEELRSMIVGEEDEGEDEPEDGEKKPLSLIIGVARRKGK